MIKDSKQIIIIIGLTVSKLLIIPGFVNFLLAFATKTDPQYNGWWIVSGIGLALSIVFLVFILTRIFKTGQLTQPQNNQIIFSSVNIVLSIGIGLLSTIFALYALDKAIIGKNTSNSSLAESQFKTAKVLNVVAFLLIVSRWLAIFLFISSLHKA
ncbi:MAG TPA: hypothetical protein DCM45_03625 [Clostridiales bacterium]|nr:hypothetical protein [Clostridiales bacterium]